MAYAQVTLTGTYKLPNGIPAKGTVEIIPSEPLILDDAGNVVLSGRVKIGLEEDGSFDVLLPATDDPGLTPVGFGYTLAAKLSHTHLPAISFSLPAAVATVDVTDVTQVDPSTFTPDANYITDVELDAALEGVVPDTSAIEADVTALDTRVGTVESTVVNKADTSTVTALDGRVDTVETALPTKQDAATVDTAVTTLVNDPASATSGALSATYAVKAGREYVDAHGGDPTGVTASDAAYAAARAALPRHPVTGYAWGSVVFSDGGVYRINNPLPNVGPSMTVEARGTRFMFHGTGSCFRIKSRWFISDSFNAPLETDYSGGAIIGQPLIDGSSAGAGSVGIHFGDGIEQRIDAIVRHFNKAGSVGVLMENTITWTEKSDVNVHLIDNATNYKTGVNYGPTATVAAASNGVTLPAATVTITPADPDEWPKIVGNGGGPKPQVRINEAATVLFTGQTFNGDGTVTLTGCTGGSGTLATGQAVKWSGTGASMGYNSLRISVGANANQDGLYVANGANLYGGSVRLRGNFTTNDTTNTSCALRLSGQSPDFVRLNARKSMIQFAQLDVQVEQAGTGVGKPQTMVMDAGNTVNSCYGVIRFGGSAWTLCNINQTGVNRLQFQGPIIGDTNLNPAGNSYVSHIAGSLILQQGNADPGTGRIWFNDGDWFQMTIGVNITVQAGNSAVVGPQRKVLIIQQNPAGGFTVTWPNPASPTVSNPAFKFPGGVAPTMTPGANAVDIYDMFSLDGATWYVNPRQDMKR